MKGLLIANRDQRARERLSAMFAPDEYRVATADSVANALEGIINKEIQVVVIDGDCHEGNVVRLVPLLKKCNRNLAIILVSEEMPLNLVRRIRQEGIFYHALKSASQENESEIYEAVCYAFKQYEERTQQALHAGKGKLMFTMKSLLSSIVVTMLLVSPVFAVDTAVTYNSGLLVLLFVGFCALIIVAQLVPALLVLFGMTKAVSKGLSQQKAVKVKSH
jgi:DNA-binding NtrC family response regulator